jgi:hypothetical protein
MKPNLSCSIGLVNAKILTEKRLKRLQANGQLERLADDIKLDVKQVLHGIVTARGEIESTRLAYPVRVSAAPQCLMILYRKILT